MGNLLTVNLWDKILRWYRGTVLYELVTHLIETFFTVRPYSNEKITLTAEGARTARNLILAVALGVIIAAVGIFYTRRYPGGFVRALLKSEAFSPEKAMTLTETGFFYSVGIRWNLKRGGALTKLVARVGDPEPPIPLELREEKPEEEKPAEPVDPEPTGTEAPEQTGEEGEPKETASPASVAQKPFDFVVDRFYIPEVLRYRAEVRYTGKGSGVLPLILTVVLAVVGSGLLCRFLPKILALVDWLL